MLTPQEVNAKTFPKAVMGGYTMAAVDDFLDKLTEDYTNLYKENTALKTKIKLLAEKMEENRQAEDSLRTILLSAKKVADDMIATAEGRKAEIEREAEEKRSALMGNAENVARARMLELQRMVQDEEQRLADKRREVDEAVAAEEYRLERIRSAMAQFLALSRSSCEEQLQILARLEEVMPPAREETVQEEKPADQAPILPAEEEAPQAPAEPLPLREEEPAEPESDPFAPRAEDGEEDAGEYTSVLPSLSSLKGRLKKGGHRREKEPEDMPIRQEDIASAVSQLMAEDENQETLFTSQEEDETRVINLDDLQFGRNYNRE